MTMTIIWITKLFFNGSVFKSNYSKRKLLWLSSWYVIEGSLHDIISYIKKTDRRVGLWVIQ